VATNPHFDLPFRFLNNAGAAVAEQDTYADIANCVEAILRTPHGFRIDAADFGVPELAFQTQPLLRGDIESVIVDQEPRSQMFFREQPDLADQLIDRIIVTVQQAS
jgi:phage baseplate assembly protein W